jgi:hypothetical protein
MGANACSPSRRCYAIGCPECDALPCHHEATVYGPHWESPSQIGPGFRYWTVAAPVVGGLGMFRSERNAQRVAAAYRDPAATLGSVLRVRSAVSADEARR